MKIVINLRAGRSGEAARRRIYRQRIYLALIARDLGHEVALQSAPELQQRRRQDGFGFARHLDEFRAVDVVHADLADLYICPPATVLRTPGTLPECPVVVWKTDKAYEHAVRLAKRVDLIVACVWRLSDFTQPNQRPAEPEGLNKTMGKVLSIPHIVHDAILQQLDEDGLTPAYLRDDVEAIRQRYGNAETVRGVGFFGARWPWREEIAKSHAGDARFEFAWTAGRGRPRSADARSMGPREYLKWTSGCRAIMQLPGDIWKCYRHCEAVMMGTPVVQNRGVIHLTPALTEKNTILVDDWADSVAILAGLERGNDIALAADAAYREGWSLRGQFRQMLKRLGLA